MLGLLMVIALLLLLFGVIGGIAISKFLFFVLIVAGIVFLIGLFTRTALRVGTTGARAGAPAPVCILSGPRDANRSLCRTLGATPPARMWLGHPSSRY
jgi:hypothetical protein